MGIFDSITDPIDAITGKSGADAIRSGRDAQIFSANQGIDATKQGYGQGISSIQGLYDQGRQAYSPFISGGTNAFSTLTGNTLAGMYSQPSFNYNPTNDPTLKFQMQQGIGAANNSLAARGGALGGNALKALTDYGQNLASTYLNQGFGRALQTQQQNQSQQQQGYSNLANLGQIGYGAASGAANLGANTGNSLANLYSGQGNNLAGLYSGIGNANAAAGIGVANAFNSGTSNLLNLGGKLSGGAITAAAAGG